MASTAIKVTKALIERFEGKVFYSTDGCHYWIGPTLNNRYGCISIGGMNRTTHRVAYQIYKGPIPGSLFVLHSCDNTLCVNPEHLFLGDAQSNTDDMYRKGRNKHPKGKGSHSHQKLPAPKVKKIKLWLAMGLNCREISKSLGLKNAVIRNIKRGLTYQNITI